MQAEYIQQTGTDVDHPFDSFNFIQVGAKNRRFEDAVKKIKAANHAFGLPPNTDPFAPLPLRPSGFTESVEEKRDREAKELRDALNGSTVFDMIGGDAKIKEIVDRFYIYLVTDPKLSKFFKNVYEFCVCVVVRAAGVVTLGSGPWVACDTSRADTSAVCWDPTSPTRGETCASHTTNSTSPTTSSIRCPSDPMIVPHPSITLAPRRRLPPGFSRPSRMPPLIVRALS
jgi:hypothetical protein